ncbi:MAG: hypothetical protein ACK5JD_09145 [Mangrovibacterium sp.]
MKTQMQPKTRQKSWIDQLTHVRYFQTVDQTTSQPMNEKRGIRCIGGACGFIVDWQVDDKKSRDARVS